MKHKGLRLGALFCAAAMTITTSAQALSVEEAYDILRRSYVDRLPRAAKDAESLDELFSYTDNYTCYMTEEEYQALCKSAAAFAAETFSEEAYLARLLPIYEQLTGKQ